MTQKFTVRVMDTKDLSMGPDGMPLHLDDQDLVVDKIGTIRPPEATGGPCRIEYGSDPVMAWEDYQALRQRFEAAKTALTSPKTEINIKGNGNAVTAGVGNHAQVGVASEKTGNTSWWRGILLTLAEIARALFLGK